MANLEKTPVQASQTGIPATYHDEQDGTYSQAVAARMRVWDGASWVRWDGATTGGGGGSVTQGTSPWVVSAASLPLPTGAAKDSTLTDGTARIGGTVAVSLASAPTTAVTQSTSPWVTNDPGLPDTLGQKAMSGSTGVVLASDQTSIPVAATLSAETTKVIGTVNQGTSPWVVSGGANVFHVDDNSSSLTVDAPVGTPVFTRLSDGSAALVGQKAMTASLPVVLASDQASVPVAATLTAETTKVIGTVNQGTSPWVVGSHAVTNVGTFAVQQTLPATGAVTSPASVTTSVATVLASNAARYMATVYNESGAICYLKLGASASLTSYTLQVAIGGYYEVPGGYTGVLTGITSASTAVLRVTEITT